MPKFQVQSKMCATCIYRKGGVFNIKELERQVADPKMPGYFKGHRICHHAPNKSKVCCAGFWAKHKDKFTLGQLAQRLGFVEKVDVDCFKRKETKNAARRRRPIRAART